MNKAKAWAQVSFNGDFFDFTVISRGILGYGDPGAQSQYLLPDAEDQSLGHTLRAVLSKSKRVSIDEFQIIFRSGIIEKTESEREKYVMERYGYKTKKAMYKNSDTCNIAAYENHIEIQPTHQDSLQTWTVKKDMGLHPLEIPNLATDAELGAALRQAFALCTSAIR